MPVKGKRRLATGIVRDRYGIEARVAVGSGETRRSRFRRYPAATNLKEIKAWQDEVRAQLKLARGTVARHTLAHDAKRYYALITPLASWRERRSEVRAWVVLYGDRPRFRITREEVLAARATWADAGLAPKTINHRVAALRHLYRTLDGKATHTPCEDVTPLTVHKSPIIVVTPETIRRVDDTLQRWEASGRLRSAKSRARFRVLASTGRRPSEIVRTQREDVDFRQRVWRPRDGKGGWGPGIYLNDDMRAAWRLFRDAGAWGYYRHGSLVRTLRAAGWPANVPPYQLRHTVGITISEAGGDLADIQAHLGHRQISTTRQHYVPVRASRMQKVSELLDGRIRWGTPAEKKARSRPGEVG